MATSRGSSNVYHDVQISGSGNTQLGNSYHYGVSEDQTILQAILRSLHYPEMGQRSHDVSDPGENTFGWIYDEHDDKCTEVETVEEQSGMFWSSTRTEIQEEKEKRNDSAAKLRNWLQLAAGDRSFWITGKPGSGKSALMKYIRDHEATDALLQEWAGENRLVTADHFFWLPGTPLQSSIEGMLRSLLYATLQHFVADLASAKAICSKKRWTQQTSQVSWSLRELKQMMVDLSRLPGVRTIFLVDGLDECCPQHTHDQFMKVLSSLMQLPHCKYLLSSRPWHEFTIRLEGVPSLCIDALTRFDMLMYARAQLTEAALGQKSFTATQAELSKLSDELASSAEGVFLWLELVIRALKIEIKKCQGMRRLQQAMEAMPHDLDEYFQKLIYERISSTSSNVSDTASALKLALVLATAEDFDRRQSFIHFWLLAQGSLERPIPCSNIDETKISASRAAEMLDQTRAFLQQTTKDLLIARTHLNSRLGEGLFFDEVKFLHRTVFDFLTGNSMQTLIDQRSPSYFGEDDFVLKLICIRAPYLLLCCPIGCNDVEKTLYAAMIASSVLAEEHRLIFQNACESVATDHFLFPGHCLGFHQIFMGNRNEEDDLYDGQYGSFHSEYFTKPFNFIRAKMHTWPHLSFGRVLRQIPPEDWYQEFSGKLISPLSSPDRYDQSIAGLSMCTLKCEHLCASCKQFMHQCLHRGLLLDQWLDLPCGLKPQDPHDPHLTPIYRVMGMKGFPIPRRPVKSANGVRQSDAQWRKCELCDIQLASPEDCGLRNAFLALEHIIYDARDRRVALTGVRVTDDKAANVPDIASEPSSIDPSEPVTITASNTSVVSAAPSFRIFLRRRQALRAAKSLAVSVGKQLSCIAHKRRSGSDYASSALGSSVHHVISDWLDFLFNFAPGLNSRLLALASPGDDSKYCGICGAQSDCKRGTAFTAYVCLQWDGFPSVCQQCFSNRVHNRDRGFNNAYFTLHILPNGDIGGVVEAVQMVVDWYLDNAAAYGLAHTVSSDVLAARNELSIFEDKVVIERYSYHKKWSTT